MSVKKQSVMEMDLSCPSDLPIYNHQDQILDAIKNNQVLIITGETGSGKTTQLPKLCLRANRGKRGPVVCTQPRRIAAMTIAQKVAQELGKFGNKLAGYHIRFQKNLSPHTKIMFVTDGLLLAQVHKDPLLNRYDTIIVDEAHERTLNIDFILGLLRKILPKRPDLKVIITSATINTKQFSEAFKNAPIINISGRGYPVDIQYMPWDMEISEEPAISEHVLMAIQEIRRIDRFNDILVFLPTENDILETVNILRERLPDRETSVLAMFGRLTTGDQKKIFIPSQRQKIVVATNIAETSITVPGIKYVVDSGLARMARYNIRSHTKALPVLPISKASANQRAGRAGRLEAGICIRLYEEEDYEQRAEFTPPEIIRSNLAEVILRLLYMGLGPVSEFPFIDPPSPQAIREGYATLRELGAITSSGKLTYIGKTMARLPLDPRISRIILQARKENALNEILIISSALSIQDPRQRPIEQTDAADQAHRKFVVQGSDFLTLLKIWERYQSVKKNETNRQLRNFCKRHFLSYNRMRQWEDTYRQLKTILDESGNFPINDRPASYDQIHRSILSGFLSHIAMYQEAHKYLGARGKELYIHPSSGLFKNRPQWIVAYEWVRTTKLFARTIATIKPKWVEELAPGLCRKVWSEPRWHKKKGDVVAWEKVIAFGLPIVERREISFSRIDPEEAKTIFITEGLTKGELSRSYDFLTHNQRLIKELRELEHKTRRMDILVDEEILTAFYEKALNQLETWATKNLKQHEKRRLYKGIISNEPALSIVLQRSKKNKLLYMTKEQLLKEMPSRDELKLFPGSLEINGSKLQLVYRFEPSDPADGVTVRIPVQLLPSLPEWPFEWLVPGLLPEKVTYLLKGLPKQLRKQLIPIPHTSEQICNELDPKSGPLLSALEQVLSKRGIIVKRSLWSYDNLPQHLMMRFEIIDPGGKILKTGRDLARLKETFSQKVTSIFTTDSRWQALKKQYEVGPVTIGNLPDYPKVLRLPDDKEKGSANNLATSAYIGFSSEKNGIWLRLFPSYDEALANSRPAILKLIMDYLKQEISYLQKNCKLSLGNALDSIYFGGKTILKNNVINYILSNIIGDINNIPSQKELIFLANSLRGKIFSKATPILEVINKILTLYLDISRELTRLKARSYKGHGIDTLTMIESELKTLIPCDFPKGISLKRLSNLPRYLEALRIRINRAYVNPSKDSEKRQAISSLEERISKIQNQLNSLPLIPKDIKDRLEYALDLMEEYKVMIFAPELKSAAMQVSKKHLEQILIELENRL